MTLNDILSHGYSAADFFARLPGKSIAEAANEPLKIAELVQLQTNMQRLRSGKIVTFGEALCFLCIEKLCSLYHRKNPLPDSEKEFIAEQMVAKYKHWSVTDLPTFINMTIGARLPSQRFNEVEYELVILDFPSILGKLASYDRMRPNSDALKGMSPERPDERPLTAFQRTRLIDGTEHAFKSETAAVRYWRSPPDMNNPRDRDFVDNCIQKCKSMAILFERSP